MCQYIQDVMLDFNQKGDRLTHTHKNYIWEHKDDNIPGSKGYAKKLRKAAKLAKTPNCRNIMRSFRQLYPKLPIETGL